MNRNFDRPTLVATRFNSSQEKKVNSSNDKNINQQSILGKMKTDFWSLDNINISDKLKELNELKIILPCGFDVEFGKKYFKEANFNCPICENHKISSEDCLNMTRNKLVLNKKLFELKKMIFEQLLKKFEVIKLDPKHFIELSHDKSINAADLRREEIKSMFNQQVDDYFDTLVEEIDSEKEERLNNADEKIREVDSKQAEIDSIKINKNLNVHSKIDVFKKGQISIENGINLVTKIEDYLTEAKFKLTNSNTDIDFEDLFGILYLKENTAFIYNEDEIGDENRTEATIELVINDFSKLEIKDKSFEFFSKPCIVKNFEWSIFVKLIYDDEKLNCYVIQFYLQCKSKEGLSNFPVKINAQFILVDSKYQNNNLIKTENFSYHKENYQGIDCFMKFNDLSDLNNYYNSENDSITFNLKIKPHILQDFQRSLELQN